MVGDDKIIWAPLLLKIKFPFSITGGEFNRWLAEYSTDWFCLDRTWNLIDLIKFGFLRVKVQLGTTLIAVLELTELIEWYLTEALLIVSWGMLVWICDAQIVVVKQNTVKTISLLLRLFESQDITLKKVCLTSDDNKKSSSLML